mmetsp:Transcript_743/g.2495  ORF Transcript_743/g.2495 Transcript_743/m.2495 type:complete len:410 (+) Transcript_743:2283-3512(+)
MFVTELCGALSMQVFGNLKTVFVSVSSVLFFNNAVGMRGIVGFVITIIGVFCFNAQSGKVLENSSRSNIALKVSVFLTLLVVLFNAISPSWYSSTSLNAQVPHEFISGNSADPAECGILFTLGLHTPKIKVYEERWKHLGGRGPYIAELIAALRTANSTQSLPIAVVTDAGKSELEELAPELYELADKVIHADFTSVKEGWGDKIVSFLESPFERTIAFDADVTLCEDIQHVCSFLNHYDIAMAREPFLIREWVNGEHRETFNEHLKNLNFHNSGVVLFRHTAHVKDLFYKWQEVHNSKGGGDQNHLADMLHEQSEIRHLVLPNVYNLRAHGGIGHMEVHGPVYVIHSRQTCLTCAFVNRNSQSRIISPAHCTIHELREGELVAQHIRTTTNVTSQNATERTNMLVERQ